MCIQLKSQPLKLGRQNLGWLKCPYFRFLWGSKQLWGKCSSPCHVHLGMRLGSGGTAYSFNACACTRPICCSGNTSVSLSISSEICMRGLGHWLQQLRQQGELLSGVYATVCFWHCSWPREGSTICWPRHWCLHPVEFIMFWRSCASSTWQPDQQSTVPRNIPYVYFSAILGTQNCEKCPTPQRERHFVPNFRSSKFRTIPFFRSERFRVKRWEFRPRHGYNFLYATFVETATFQPKTAGQTFNHTSSGHVGSTAMGFCPRNLKHTSASHRISGSLSWFAHNCNLWCAHEPQVTFRGNLVVICLISCREANKAWGNLWGG